MRFEILPPVPAVTIARRLHEIPLFRFASVDELFRISAISQQVRYDERAAVQERGRKAEYIQVLVDGRLRVESPTGDTRVVEPPAMLGFQEALEGTPVRETAHAESESIALVMLTEEFRSLLSANIELAAGLFRLLVSENGDASATLDPDGELGAGSAFVFEHKDKPLRNIDKVMYLQALPMLSRATGEEIYEVAAIAREVSFQADEVLAEEGDAPSIVLPLTGALELVLADGSEKRTAVAIPPGAGVGVRETLAGVPWKGSLRGRTPGKVLEIERDSFFDLLGDRVNLLQAIFGALFRKQGG